MNSNRNDSNAAAQETSQQQNGLSYNAPSTGKGTGGSGSSGTGWVTPPHPQGMTYPPGGIGYYYPMRRGLDPYVSQQYRSVAAPPWNGGNSGGLGKAPIGPMGGPRPMGGPGFPGGRPGFGAGPMGMGMGRPGLDPDTVKKFLTEGVGRLNTLMTGIERVSKTVQQLNPLVEMVKNWKGSGQSVSKATTEVSDADVEATPAGAGRRSSRSRKSAAAKKRRKR